MNDVDTPSIPEELSAFAQPREARYFEDYRVGDVYRFGTATVSEEEVVEFARRYDPQSFHVDRAAAERSMFGGLIASGWHTAALMMRMLVDHYVSAVASLASPGVDALRWLAPVRPGDSLSLRVEVIEARRSRSKPDRGVVRARVEVLNQHRQAVMSVEAVSLFACREPASA
jgi:acyl dehydratase